MKPPAKRVPRSGRIVWLLEGERGNTEDAMFVDQHGAIFTALHDQSGRTHFEDVPGRPEEVVFAGKFAGLRVVDHQDIDVLKGFAEFGIGTFNPIIHGVHGGDLGLVLHLMEDVALEVRSNVREEHVFGVAVFFRQAWLEFSEDV